jgi:hypothetical protein
VIKLSGLEKNFAIFFPLFFVMLWLTVSTILGSLSGWFRLTAKFPNQAIEPTLRIRGQSGMMGPVRMGGILTLSVCPSGLRVGMTRLFGPFCHDFFVPWDSIAVTRKTTLFWPLAELRFGDPVIGTLSISGHVADRLARAALGRWPEAGPFHEETRSDVFGRLLVEWAIMTCFVALFFTLVPLAVAPPKARPPILVAILFPAIVFGLASIVRFFRRTG